jgi:hypothetical protein
MRRPCKSGPFVFRGRLSGSAREAAATPVATSVGRCARRPSAAPADRCPTRSRSRHRAPWRRMSPSSSSRRLDLRSCSSSIPGAKMSASETAPLMWRATLGGCLAALLRQALAVRFGRSRGSFSPCSCRAGCCGCSLGGPNPRRFDRRHCGCVRDERRRVSGFGSAPEVMRAAVDGGRPPSACQLSGWK